MQFERDRQGRVVGYSGLIFELLDQVLHSCCGLHSEPCPLQVGRRLNFTYVVQQPPDRLWGDIRGGQVSTGLQSSV